MSESRPELVSSLGKMMRENLGGDDVLEDLVNAMHRYISVCLTGSFRFEVHMDRSCHEAVHGETWGGSMETVIIGPTLRVMFAAEGDAVLAALKFDGRCYAIKSDT